MSTECFKPDRAPMGLSVSEGDGPQLRESPVVRGGLATGREPQQVAKGGLLCVIVIAGKVI